MVEVVEVVGGEGTTMPMKKGDRPMKKGDKPEMVGGEGTMPRPAGMPTEEEMENMTGEEMDALMTMMMDLEEECAEVCEPMVNGEHKRCEDECEGVLTGGKAPEWCRAKCTPCADCWGMELPPVEGSTTE